MTCITEEGCQELPTITKNQAHHIVSKWAMTAYYDRFPGADWPTEQAFIDAHIFIDTLPYDEFLEPFIALAHDGEINFLWKEKEKDIYLDLGFYGDHTYSYYGRGRGIECSGDDIDVEDGITARLSRLIRVKKPTLKLVVNNQ